MDMMLPTYQRIESKWNNLGTFISNEQDVCWLFSKSQEYEAIIPSYIYANMLVREKVSVVNNGIHI